MKLTLNPKEMIVDYKHDIETILDAFGTDVNTIYDGGDNAIYDGRENNLVLSTDATCDGPHQFRCALLDSKNISILVSQVYKFTDGSDYKMNFTVISSNLDQIKKSYTDSICLFNGSDIIIAKFEFEGKKIYADKIEDRSKFDITDLGSMITTQKTINHLCSYHEIKHFNNNQDYIMTIYDQSSKIIGLRAHPFDKELNDYRYANYELCEDGRLTIKLRNKRGTNTLEEKPDYLPEHIVEENGIYRIKDHEISTEPHKFEIEIKGNPITYKDMLELIKPLSTR